MLLKNISNLSLMTPMRRWIFKIIFIILFSKVTCLANAYRYITTDNLRTDSRKLQNLFSSIHKNASENISYPEMFNHIRIDREYNTYIFFLKFAKITNNLNQATDINENIIVENFSKHAASDINFNHKLHYYIGINTNIRKEILKNQKFTTLFRIDHNGIKSQKLIDNYRNKRKPKYEIDIMFSTNYISENFEEDLKYATLIKKSYDANEKIAIETSLFDSKLFFEVYKNFVKKNEKLIKIKRLTKPGKKLSHTLKTRSFHVLVFKNFWSKIRANYMHIGNIIKLWNCLSRHFIVNGNDKTVKRSSNNDLFICFCASLVTTKNNKQVLNFLNYNLKKSATFHMHQNYNNSTSSEKQVDINERTEYMPSKTYLYFELNDTVDENTIFNIFDTFSHALLILTSKVSEKIIFQNIRNIYRETDEVRYHEMYFRCIYHIIKTIQFTKMLKESYLSNIKIITNSDTRLSCIIDELDICFYKMHKNVCKLFNQWVIPYLNEINQGRTLYQKVEDSNHGKNYDKIFKNKRYLKDYICSLLAKWLKLIDSCGLLNAKALKYGIYINCLSILRTHQIIYTLASMLTAISSKSIHHLNFHLLLEHIVLSQFDPEKVELFFDQYEQYYKINCGNSK
ncbi:uncharacterized protein VICG_02119 [Vittaforma corneae ATCC 50505]|uniref:Uncharacterized protein n=1 Tax=Vittaforma corneae (strain ATCC 50505) TaxID=993615 RepID=L2GJZ7_VITCO|nr:uncharacterized protein VICG_02119 [Vittaforma corneae ATCC 50505]ELA40845.1 hypothetical protein VICG_02119 [Vittaforma corneae ATCC 50505]